MILRILLVDADADRSLALEDHLRRSGFGDVARLSPGADLVAAVESGRPDIVIIDMDLPDRDALEDIRAVADKRPIVMFGGADDLGFIEEAIEAGVSSYNLTGVALQDVKPILAAAIAHFRRRRTIESELAAAKTLLEGRQTIERAKALLMRERKMTEPEAYRWLRRKAMNENRKLALVAADLVREEPADGRRTQD